MAIVPSATQLVPAHIRELCKDSDVVQRFPNVWEVRGGTSLQVFLEFVGPPTITGCNLVVTKPFGVTSKGSNLLSVKTHCTSRRSGAVQYSKHSLSDSFTLTPAGTELLAQNDRLSRADPVVVRGTKYCSGKPATSSSMRAAARDGPNCRRACGGMGQCSSACTASTSLGHCCQLHITLKMTLGQVFHNKVTVTLLGSHVQADSVWIPCPLQSLSTSSLVMDNLIHDAAVYGQTATSVTNRSAGSFDCSCSLGSDGSIGGQLKTSSTLMVSNYAATLMPPCPNPHLTSPPDDPNPPGAAPTRADVRSGLVGDIETSRMVPRATVVKSARKRDSQLSRDRFKDDLAQLHALASHHLLQVGLHSKCRRGARWSVGRGDDAGWSVPSMFNIYARSVVL